jgi:hypothetical protein
VAATEDTGTGEISSELLKRVISDDGGHEQDTSDS